MTTKAKFITQLKAEYPTLRTGSEDKGYTDFTQAEYDAKIAEWADNKVAKEAKEIADSAADAQLLIDKANGEAKLLAVGLTKAEIKAIRKD